MRVTLSPETGGDDELGSSVRLCAAQFVGDGLRYLAKINSFAPHFGSRDSGQVQKVINQRAHALDGRPDALQIFFPFAVELTRIVLKEGLAESINATKRCAEIMGHGIAKRLQFAIRGFELGVLSGHLLFDYFSFGHVPSYFPKSAQLAHLVPQCGHHHIGPESGAVLANTPTLVLRSPLLRRNLKFPSGLAAFNVVRRIEPRKVLANDFVGSVAFDSLRSGVPGGHAPIRVEHQ